MSATESIAKAWREATGSDEGEQWFETNLANVLDLIDAERAIRFPYRHDKERLVSEEGTPGEGERWGCPRCYLCHIMRRAPGMQRNQHAREVGTNWYCYRCERGFDHPVVVDGPDEPLAEGVDELIGVNEGEWPPQEGESSP